MNITVQKLNQLGVSHLVVPIITLLAVGGIGSFVAVKSMSHADAAVPNLSCFVSWSPASGTTVPQYKGKINATITFTNTGGGKTTGGKYVAGFRLISSSNVIDATGRAPVAKAGYGNDSLNTSFIPALTHGQKAARSMTFDYTNYPEFDANHGWHKKNARQSASFVMEGTRYEYGSSGFHSPVNCDQGAVRGTFYF